VVTDEPLSALNSANQPSLSVRVTDGGEGFQRLP